MLVHVRGQRAGIASGQWTSALLVQRVVRDPGHCGFTNAEWEDGLKSLIAWVERGEKPEGEDVLTDDLRTLGEKFTVMPRHGSPEADGVPGAADRVTLRGNLTLDGVPFSAGFLGAAVRRDGLTAACQYNLAQVVAGQYELTVMADAEDITQREARMPRGAPGGDDAPFHDCVHCCILLSEFRRYFAMLLVRTLLAGSNV